MTDAMQFLIAVSLAIIMLGVAPVLIIALINRHRSRPLNEFKRARQRQRKRLGIDAALKRAAQRGKR